MRSTVTAHLFHSVNGVVDSCRPGGGYHDAVVGHGAPLVKATEAKAWSCDTASLSC